MNQDLLTDPDSFGRHLLAVGFYESVALFDQTTLAHVLFGKISTESNTTFPFQANREKAISKKITHY